MQLEQSKQDEILQKLLQVRKSWAAKLPEKIMHLQRYWQAVRKEPAIGDATVSLYQLVHNLAGSSGVFGFPEIGLAARRCEIWLRALVDEQRHPRQAECEEIGRLIEELVQSCQRGIADGVPMPDLSPSLVTQRRCQGHEQHLVYLVEDDLELAEELCQQLALYGFQVEHFDHLTGFITAFKRQEPAAVIMDVQLPDGKGTEALGDLQKHRSKPINSVFITVHDDIHTRLNAIRVGAEAFLAKPLDVTQLIETLSYLTRGEVIEPYRVLIVEDSFSLSRHFSLLLEQAGMEVKWINDPFQIFAALVDFLPDLVLMDLCLPGCNGQELAELVRQQDSFLSIPIVYLSSEAERKKQQYGFSLSGEDYLDKSMAPEALVEAVATRAKRSRSVQNYLSQDALTGLPNRNAYKHRLRQTLRLCHRTEQQLALAKIDINQFKKVNDSLGTQVGDALLQQVAGRLQARLRPGDLLCRLGGDEFAALFLSIHDRGSAKTAVGKLMEALHEPLSLAERDLHLSASTGVTLYPDDALDADTLNTQADLALHAAKRANQGQNHLCFFEPDLDINAKYRLNLENELRQALVEEQFVLHYQPKLSLVTGTIIGMEALVRWQHPERGLLLPTEFVALSEENGLIQPLGEWILRRACLDNRHWLDQGFDLRVAVNLSSRQFERTALLQLVDQVLAETGLPADNLELEITESMMMEDVESVIELLNALRSRGLSIAVDDFGTGYSSLSYLKRFPIHTLKIDQSFIREMHAEESDLSIVKAIISLGQSLHLHVVAEGVEQIEQLKLLERCGCELVQGYYFSLPLDRDTFEQLLQQQGGTHPPKRTLTTE